MLIRLLTIGDRMPGWVVQGFHEYAKRLTHHYRLELIELPAEKRTASSLAKNLIERESEKLLSAVKKSHLLIALTEQGKLWTTQQLADTLQKSQSIGQNIDFIIGGPDGLSKTSLQKASACWSLSPLTFPHPLVRILVAEQIYRATTILQGHPYHRA